MLATSVSPKQQDFRRSMSKTRQKRPKASVTLWALYGGKPLVLKRKGKSIFAPSSYRRGYATWLGLTPVASAASIPVAFRLQLRKSKPFNNFLIDILNCCFARLRSWIWYRVRGIGENYVGWLVLHCANSNITTLRYFWFGSITRWKSNTGSICYMISSCLGVLIL